jgi:hypothetical protein
MNPLTNKKIPITRLSKWYDETDSGLDMKYNLYGLYCPINDDLKYVGITLYPLNKRLSSHLSHPTNNVISNWFSELKMLGKKPNIKLLKECKNYEDLIQSEIDTIKYYKDLGYDLFNMSNGGFPNPMLGKKHTEESKSKMSIKQKGKKLTDTQKDHLKNIMLKKYYDINNKEWSDNQRKSLSELHKNNKHNLGNKHTEETKRKLSELHKNNKHNLGNKHKEETMKKLSELNKGEKNPMYGVSLPKETLKKRSDKVINEGIFKGKNNPNYKYDICKKDIYNLYILKNMSVKEISNSYNCSVSLIRQKMKMFDIKEKKIIRNKYGLDINEINNYLSEGLSQVEIGSIYGCSNKIINKFIKNNKNESTK